MADDRVTVKTSGASAGNGRPSGDSADESGDGSLVRRSGDVLGPRGLETLARIVEAARSEFLRAGYAGATVDEIASVAEMSRASFYTYFSSKRDVLFAVGEQAAQEAIALIGQLADVGPTRAAMTRWAGEYFDFLDVHGGFTFAWLQAAAQDPEIRAAGMRRHLGIVRRFGRLLATTAGRVAGDAVVLGLTASSAMEQSWNYTQLYDGTIVRQSMIDSAAEVLWSLARSAEPKDGR